MSKLVKMFRSISTEQVKQNEDNVNVNISQYSDNKIIEQKLSESIRLKQDMINTLNNEYEQKVKNINENFGKILTKLEYLPSDFKNNEEIKDLIAENLYNIAKKVSEIHYKSLKQAEDDKNDQILKIELKNKETIDLIYKQSIIDSLMYKINNPSSDLELGMAIGIILLKDSDYKSVPYNHESNIMLRQYFANELNIDSINCLRNFEEHLVNKAKQVLVKVLASEAIQYNSDKSHNKLQLKPNVKNVKLTDTDISHSFNVYSTE